MEWPYDNDCRDPEENEEIINNMHDVVEIINYSCYEMEIR